MSRLSMSSFMNAANAVTLLGAVVGLAGALLAIEGHLAYAFAALVVCGLCDVFDGLIARKLTRTDDQRTFGARLDSIVDAVVFGAFPAVILYSSGMKDPAELALLAVFLCCAVWRLAYFDTIGLGTRDGAARYYHGLPTTFTALAVPLVCMAGFYNDQALRLAANIATAGLAVAMVSPMRFPKPRGFMYVLIPTFAVGMLISYLAFAAQFPGTQPPLY